MMKDSPLDSEKTEGSEILRTIGESNVGVK